MDRMKPWQIGLFVGAVVVLGASLAWSMMGGEKVNIAGGITVVDVKTGDLYSVNLRGSRSVMIPARHPETKERTLFPVIKEDGEWRLVERYARALERVEGEKIDIDRYGTVTPSSSKVTRYVAPERD